MNNDDKNTTTPKSHSQLNKAKIEEFKSINASKKNKKNISKDDIPTLLDTQVIMKIEPKKNLYDTVVIKLDDLIKNKKVLKSNSSKKITNTEKYVDMKHKRSLLKKDITKHVNDIHIKVNSSDFFIQQRNLCIIALSKICSEIDKKTKEQTRKHSTLVELNTIKNIHVNKTNYLINKEKLNDYATRKMYNKYAPKETPKYKMYKYSVIMTSIVFIVSLISIVQWFYEGYAVKDMTENMINEIAIEEINSSPDDLYNVAESDAYSYKKKTSLYWKYLNTPLQSVNLKSLVKQNKDTIGWLTVNNTNVNYPVVQTDDNDYYLHHSFDKSFNYAGWVFADYRDNFDDFNNNMVIYGHGRKDKVMFGSLLQTVEADWYTNVDNQIIQLSTLKYNTMWQIFSVYTIESESYYITTNFSNTDAFKKFITTIKGRSVYDFGIELNENDKILTLSTCYNDTGTRLVIHAKLVTKQDK